jgi:CBS domain-containing protein
VFRYAGGRRDWFAAGRAMEGKRARQLQAGALARRDVPTCGLDARLGDVRTRLQDSGFTACIVVNGAGVVLGRLRRAALGSKDPATPVEAAMDVPTTYRPDTPLESLIGAGRAKAGAALVITDLDGVLIGVIDQREARRRLGETRRATGRGRRARPATRAKGSGSRRRARRTRAKRRA